MSENIAIKVQSVSKDFVLPHEKTSSVKSLFTGVARRRKKTKIEVQHALRDISFEIKQGEFFGIVGRNGSGKSTMLKILAGIYQPSKGSSWFEGKLVPFIELGVGFNPELTGRENVYLNGAMLGFSKSEVDKMYDEIVEFAELNQFMDKKLKNYSSGMQVRLAFSMAIRAEADILLVDEVLAVGDAAFQRKCLDYFRTLKKNKKTVVFVSHDMDAVRTFCDRAALIEKSKLVKVGSAGEIADMYAHIFAKEAENDQVQSSKNPQNRWGSGDAIFSAISVSNKVFTDKIDTIEFGGTITFKERVENPVIGFRFNDSTGKAITGTNTELIREVTGEFQKGQTVAFSWSVPNILSNGQYNIDFAIVSEIGAGLDVWNEALIFDVIKSVKTPYIVAPPPQFKLDSSKK